MKQVLFRKGQAVTEEIPAPNCEPGAVLVRVEYSCISTGTELSGIQASGEPLWKRALRNPQAVGTVLKLAASQGVASATSVVRTAVDAGQPTGYSAAGTVVECGEGVVDFTPGQQVACAGAQCAHHAEWIRVPVNLAVPVPEGVKLSEASTVALGAIALQGVRRALPTLGETFVVLGLGLLGQLTCQLLRAHGCRVIGADLDAKRRDLAIRLGANLVLDPDADSDIAQVARLTAAAGADGVLITASSPSDTVVSTAFRMCRKKGRVVLVGDVGLHLRRADIYEKEIDFFVSTSYGPGRYDRRYEAEGVDYPIGYVRWTENRNMHEYLRLIADRKVDVASLIEGEFPIEKASEAYQSLQSTVARERPLAALIAYPHSTAATPHRTVSLQPGSPKQSDGIGLAVIGAGSFASGVHLPNIAKLGSLFSLEAIVNRTGHRALALAKQFHARRASTDIEGILGQKEIDAVLVTTRHDHHANLALNSLRAGKHVLVEKPLCLEARELEELESLIAGYSEGSGPRPLLMTGFNRRFSPHIRHIRKLIQDRSDSLLFNYRMNAGYLPPDHWVHGPEGGGRNRGEACHLYDLAIALVGAQVERIAVEKLRPRHGHYSSRDNFVATLSFADGSVASITYTSLGSAAYPKEQLELYVDGAVICMNDYRETTVFGRTSKGLTTRLVEKGHREELEAFGRSILNGGEWPIPWWEQVAATRVSLEVERQLSQ